METKSKTAAYVISPDLSSALAAADDALTVRTRIDDAISLNQADIKTAQVGLKKAEDEQAAAEADLALVTDEKEARSLEKNVQSAIEKTADMRRTVDRQNRIRPALFAKARAADVAITAARTDLNIVLSAFLGAISDQQARELSQAIKPFFKWVQRAMVIQRSTGLRAESAFTQVVPRNPMLDRLLDPLTIFQSIITDGQELRVDDLSTDAEMAAVVDAFQPIVAIETLFRKHRPFEEPKPSAGPYVRRGYEIRGANDSRSSTAPSERQVKPKTIEEGLKERSEVHGRQTSHASGTAIETNMLFAVNQNHIG